MKKSATGADVDFYGLDFRSTKAGLFVGSRCRRGDPDVELEVKDAAGCAERVPVIYEFTDRDDEGPVIRESSLGFES